MPLKDLPKYYTKLNLFFHSTCIVLGSNFCYPSIFYNFYTEVKVFPACRDYYAFFSAVNQFTYKLLGFYQGRVIGESLTHTV